MTATKVADCKDSHCAKRKATLRLSSLTLATGWNLLAIKDLPSPKAGSDARGERPASSSESNVTVGKALGVLLGVKVTLEGRAGGAELCLFCDERPLSDALPTRVVEDR